MSLRGKTRAVGLAEALAFVAELARVHPGRLDAALVLAVEERAEELRAGGMTLAQSVEKAAEMVLRERAAGFEEAREGGKMAERTVYRAARCPRCDSPSPELHPAVQHEGEVQPCLHPWHGPPQTPNDAPANEPGEARP
jgi:hypothetical protein